MRCTEASKALDAYRSGELTRKEHQEISLHLAACPGCAAELAGVHELAARIVRLRLRAPWDVFRHVESQAADRFAAVETDLGRLWVGFNARGITLIDPGGTGERLFLRSYAKRIGRTALQDELPPSFERAIHLAVAGKARRDVCVDLSGLSSFQKAVLDILRKIPRGEVRPYEWLAREAGRPRAVRAVGNTMAHNPVPLLLPCHRVVPASGGIGKYAFGSAMKRTLLEREGVPLEQMEQYTRSGVRYVGCRSTGIYCYPSCRDARRVKAGNRVPFGGVREAMRQGFRPCGHCRPQ